MEEIYHMKYGISGMTRLRKSIGLVFTFGILSLAFAFFAGCGGGDTKIIPVGTMASIPAGCFDMGDAFNEGSSVEWPVHNVCVSAFQMDIYEVTNAQFKACVDAGFCTDPENSTSYTRSSYYRNSTYDNYPVILVSWTQANAFCIWAGGRLPTEAEWEYAARGGLAGKRYPWGDNAPVCTLGASNGSNYSECSPADTIAVGSFAANGYGLYDLAGNIWEWVNDWFDSGYYSTSPTQDPQGPDSGTNKVMRGGDFESIDLELRVSKRWTYHPSIQARFIGFRCAK
ncbi:MAG: formylglycine-generating enzyme family protein [bacterium]|nr:formylglycine-generating enzyme family protein [bacterium]